MQGKVKAFKEEKGYGFIKPDDGSKDVFVHINALPRGVKSLSPGDVVSFDVVAGRDDKTQADNVRVIG